MTRATAPAKLILCGEHAVVYGRPAIAVPLGDLRAFAEVAPGAPGTGLQLLAPDLGESWTAIQTPGNPLSELALTTAARLGLAGADLIITLGSAIPIAGGMGSGAAIGTAMVRALAAHAGATLTPAESAELVYASEKRFHGTPSGIDNTVVAYERAIWFVRMLDQGPKTKDQGSEPSGPSQATPVPGSPLIEPIRVGAPINLILGDTGVRSATRLPVGAVRKAWQARPEEYEALFDAVGDLVTRARVALATGEPVILGHLLDANQALLERIGVSSPELERLVAAAREAGALGAKLSGAGWGGIMFALVTPETQGAVEEALRAAGAARVLRATLQSS